MFIETAEAVPPETMRYLSSQAQDLEVRFAPDACNTIGLLAVKADIVRTIVLTEAEQWLPTELPSAEAIVVDQLEIARQRIVAIDVCDMSDASSKVIGYKVPQFLLNNLGVAAGSQIFERLAEKSKREEWTIPNETFLNLLQWHNYRMIGAHDQFVHGEMPIIEQGYRRNIKNAVKDGWLPECVLETRRLKALDRAETIVDDGMLTRELGVEAQTSSYEDGSGVELMLLRNATSATVAHEFCHVMVGTRKPINKHQTRQRPGLASLGLHRLFASQYYNAGKAIDEAVTEHIALTLAEIDPNPDAINPGAKGVYNDLLSAYHKERRLLDALCNGGAKPVDIRLFTRAYFENSSRLRQPALKFLKRKLEEAFPGRQVLNQLADFLSEGDYSSATENLDEFTRNLRTDYLGTT